MAINYKTLGASRWQFWAGVQRASVAPCAKVEDAPQTNRSTHAHADIDYLVDWLLWARTNSKKSEGWGVSVLDLGCGDGELLSCIKEKVPDSCLLGVDTNIAGQSAYQFLESATSCEMVPCDALDMLRVLQRNDVYFDYIVCTHLFEHVPKSLRSEFVRLLVEQIELGGSTVFLEVPNVESPTVMCSKYYSDLTHDWPVTERWLRSEILRHRASAKIDAYRICGYRELPDGDSEQCSRKSEEERQFQTVREERKNLSQKRPSDASRSAESGRLSEKRWLGLPIDVNRKKNSMRSAESAWHLMLANRTEEEVGSLYRWARRCGLAAFDDRYNLALVVE